MERLIKVLYFAVFVLVFCCTTNVYCKKKVVLRKTMSVQSQLQRKNVTYVVRFDFDLKGTMISIPQGCKLCFQGGKFINGTIRGNGTSISAKKEMIFGQVTLDGSWINKKVFSEWLDFVEGEKVDNARNFNNLMLLCTGKEMTNLYMQSGIYYCSVVTESSNIKVPSNLYWHNAATICQRNTDISRYSLVLLHKSDNVIIEGGEFVGDLRTHKGDNGEWGHGIKLAGASNVILKNLICREFWGDGIDLIEADYISSISAGVGPCEKIFLDNVKCLYNRRQGLSIEAANKVEVRNSEFAYTGKYRMTAPGCGIDIEPWCTNEEKINQIYFYNCLVHDNNPLRDFCLEPNAKFHASKWLSADTSVPVNRIVIDRCQTGKLYIHGANTVSITNSEVDEIIHYNFGYNIMMNNCTFKKNCDIKDRSGLLMKNCK